MKYIVALPLLAACGGVHRPSQSEVDQQRAVCGYHPGMLARDTLPSANPVGNDMPIDHFILIMQENRSFDHYYSSFPGVDGAAPDVTNPDAQGHPVSRFHFTTKCMNGGDHGWDGEHANLDGGKLDGFVITNSSPVPMGYYDSTELGYYYTLASTFAISDRHFSSVLGPTWPNRMFYFAGTSWGFTNNKSPPGTDPQGNPYPNLFSELDDAKVSWRVYYHDVPTPPIAAAQTFIADFENFHKVDDVAASFAADVAGGTLASVSIVEASDLLGNLSPDEGPPGDVDIGQQFVSGVIAAIMNSPFWKTSAIIISYDENGGMYDHVVPPAACAPDSIAPNNGGSVGFDQYGFRVPLLAVSPYAKRGFISHVVTDHTSVLRFVEARFGLPSMTVRDANAQPIYDLFDFAHPDYSLPSLPTVTVSQDPINHCPS
jgi:phospholipase C